MAFFIFKALFCCQEFLELELLNFPYISWNCSTKTCVVNSFLLLLSAGLDFINFWSSPFALAYYTFYKHKQVERRRVIQNLKKSFEQAAEIIFKRLAHQVCSECSFDCSSKALHTHERTRVGVNYCWLQFWWQ